MDPENYIVTFTFVPCNRCIEYIKLETDKSGFVEIGNSKSTTMTQTVTANRDISKLGAVKGYINTAGQLTRVQLLWTIAEGGRCNLDHTVVKPPPETPSSSTPTSPTSSPPATYTSSTPPSTNSPSPSSTSEPFIPGTSGDHFEPGTTHDTDGDPFVPLPEAKSPAPRSGGEETPAAPAYTEDPSPAEPSMPEQQTETETPSSSTEEAEPSSPAPTPAPETPTEHGGDGGSSDDDIDADIDDSVVGDSVVVCPARPLLCNTEASEASPARCDSAVAGTPAQCVGGCCVSSGKCAASSCLLSGLGKDVMDMQCMGTNLLITGHKCAYLACKVRRGLLLE